MLDKLIDLIVQFIQLFQVYTFVDEYERGIVLRCGRVHRLKGPGLRFLLPFGFERMLTTNIKPEPMDLAVQSAHTSDDYAVNLQVVVIFQVVDIKQYLIETEYPNESIAASCQGLLTERVQSMKWKRVNSPELAKGLRAAMDRRARKRGCQILEVHIKDCSNGAANRFWHEGIEINA